MRSLRRATLVVCLVFAPISFVSAQSDGGDCYHYPDTSPHDYEGMWACGDWGYGCTECVVDLQAGQTCITDGNFCRDAGPYQKQMP